MRLEKIIFTLGIILFIKTGQAQQCDNKFVNYSFRIELCNEQGWQITEQRPFLNIIAGDKRITLYAAHNTPLKTPKQRLIEYMQQIKGQNEKAKVIMNKQIRIDTVNGYMGVCHVPSLNTAQNQQKEEYFIASCYVYDGFYYLLENNCEPEDYQKNKELVRAIAEDITLISLKQEPLTGKETKMLYQFRDSVFKVLKQPQNNDLQHLMVSREKLLAGFNKYIKDEAMKNRFQKVITGHWDQFTVDILEELKQNYNATIQSGRNNHNIDWNEIDFIEFGFYINPDNFIPGMKSLNSYIEFGYKNQKYKIDGMNLILLVDGWYIIEFNSDELKPLD